MAEVNKQAARNARLQRAANSLGGLLNAAIKGTAGVAAVLDRQTGEEVVVVVVTYADPAAGRSGEMLVARFIDLAEAGRYQLLTMAGAPAPGDAGYGLLNGAGHVKPIEPDGPDPT